MDYHYYSISILLTHHDIQLNLNLNKFLQHQLFSLRFEAYNYSFLYLLDLKVFELNQLSLDLSY